jgi:hypothetical protein
LYDEYFAEPRGFGSTVMFRYDYVLLARALVKIAYNSARSAGSDHQPLARLRLAILGKEPWPDHVALFVELVSPTKVPDSSEQLGYRIVLPENFYRSAITKLLIPAADRVHTRVVAINSFYFHLMLPTAAKPTSEFEDIAAMFPLLIKGAVRLHPRTSEIVLTSSPQDAIRSIAPHVQAHAEQYRSFFAKRK